VADSNSIYLSVTAVPPNRPKPQLLGRRCSWCFWAADPRVFDIGWSHLCIGACGGDVDGIRPLNIIFTALNLGHTPRGAPGWCGLPCHGPSSFERSSGWGQVKPPSGKDIVWHALEEYGWVTRVRRHCLHLSSSQLYQSTSRTPSRQVQTY